MHSREFTSEGRAAKADRDGQMQRASKRQSSWIRAVFLAYVFMLLLGFSACHNHDQLRPLSPTAQQSQFHSSGSACHFSTVKIRCVSASSHIKPHQPPTIPVLSDGRTFQDHDFEKNSARISKSTTATRQVSTAGPLAQWHLYSHRGLASHALSFLPNHPHHVHTQLFFDQRCVLHCEMHRLFLVYCIVNV